MILLFVVLAPLVVLYAQGYRLDAHEGRIVQTGVLVLTSEPSRASVSLNGEKQAEHTTSEINAIRTGTYTVTVAKDGFIPWEKELAVLPGRSTIADDIVLFRKDSTMEDMLLHDDLVAGTALPGNRFLLTTQEGNTANLYYWFTPHEEPILLTTQKGTMAIMDVHEGAQQVLLKFEHDGLVRYAVGNLAPYAGTNSPPREPLALLPLDTLLPPSPDEIAWDLRDSTLLWILKGGTLSRLDLFTEELTSIKGTTKNILANATGLLRVVEEDGTTRIEKNSRDDFQTLFTINDTGFTLLNEKNKIFTLSTARETALYDVPRPDVIRKEVIGGPAQDAVWQGNRYILLTTTIGIEVYDRTTRARTQLGRFGNSLRDVQWYANNAYVAYMQNGRATIVEIDQRDKRNGIALSVPDTTRLLGFSTDEKFAWFLAGTDGVIPGRFWAVRLR
jgi:hypothetical protein